MNLKSVFSRWLNVSALRHYVYYRHIHERPRWGFRNRVTKSVSRSDFPELARTLVAQGVVILPSYFSNESLKGMQDDFDRWADSDTLNENGEVQLASSYLPDSIELSKASMDPFLTALVKHYWGKPIFLSATAGYRLEPIIKEDYGSWQWHHDAKRKQARIMILLSDVPDDGQRMDYLAGTHKIWHRNQSTYEDTRFTPESMRKYGDPVHCSGPAGTVLIFDTNGLHRGNRNLGPRRDVWMFSYTAGRRLSPLPGLHPDVVKTMTPEDARMTRTA